MKDKWQLAIEKFQRDEEMDDNEIFIFAEAVGDLDLMHRIAFPECPIKIAHCHKAEMLINE